MTAEDALQIQLVAIIKQYLRPNVLFWHTPNGGKRDKRTARLMKCMGVLPGVADLIFIQPGPKVDFVEIKEGDGRMSSDQERFMEASQRSDCSYYCATGFDEAIAVLNSIGVLRVRLTNSVSDAASDVGMRAGGAGSAHAPPQSLTETDRALT
ncbi:VRR-NUC domain-containing protein [Bosea sp. AS-1]|uniref:VRR-NUC domain-containing protein n=1 Tax=Bosea sp. AS-1 TaxID=2015316 RepID=UPI000B7729D8|nr:VRR-NUC domain-containing protein [Bosea sp. AS-1]